MSKLLKVVRIGILCAMSAGPLHAAHAQSDDYILGQGLNAGSFNIAGYATVEAHAKKGQDAGLLIDDLSLFVKGSVNRVINPFLEVEMAEADLWFEGSPPLKNIDPRVDIERLYNDFILDDHVTFRVGKILSPVGEWNSIHAGPLVWTTTRPLTSYRNYPEFVTGVSAIAEGLGAQELRVETYWQPGSDLDGPDPSNVAYLFHNTYGLHAELPLGLTDKIGLSLQGADVKGTREKQFLVGLNGRFTLDRLEIETEMTWTALKHPLVVRKHKTEYAGYVQGAFAISDKLYLIGRGEFFRDRNFDRTSRNFLIGLNYRPKAPISWKLEYVEQSGPNLGISSGPIASFNILF
ncbi:MAG: hypothetical protein KDE14_01090 [Rhodobacteraceae bacterium]|nr:hypothetical protein [Paracoccaceae bacterium]